MLSHLVVFERVLSMRLDISQERSTHQHPRLYPNFSWTPRPRSNIHTRIRRTELLEDFQASLTPSVRSAFVAQKDAFAEAKERKFGKKTLAQRLTGYLSY